MKYYLIAGEASGDLHASNLMKALKGLDSEAEFRFIGGDLMKSIGGSMMKHFREVAYMGIIPVIKHLGVIMRTMGECQKDVRDFHPDVVILIDYPGFNLKMAKFVKTQLHIPVHYYISPKIWAWKQYRIHAFRKYVDRMFCILPFEPAFFDKLHYKVDYVGNPSVDSVDEFFHALPKENVIAEDKPVLALLAGSRRQEIKDNLPAMLEVAEAFPQYQAVIAGAPAIDPDYYALFTKGKEIRIVYNQTYSLLHESSFALVTSGTATLETALFRVPQVVCYYFPGGNLVNFVYRHFFHAPYISLVNLIAGREVVQELFGGRFTVLNIKRELSRLITDSNYKGQMLQGYDDIIHTLGKPGASKRAAELIFEAIKKK